MTGDLQVLLLIGAMGVISMGSRTIGYVVMRWVPAGGGVERALRALPGAVIISILAPVVASGDWGARMALLVVPLLVLRRFNIIAAVAAGAAVAAAARALG